MKKNKILNIMIGVAIGIVLSTIVTIIIWPERIATIKSGEEIVASVKGKTITAEDLYSELRGNYGITTVINSIDEYILKDKYDIADEMLEEAKTNAESIYSNYEQYYGMSKSEFLSENGFKDEDEFIQVLVLESYSNYHVKKYVEKNLTDKDIEDYYNNKYFEEKEAIVIINSTSEDNLSVAAKMLKNGSTVEEVKKKYSDLTVMDYQHLDYKNSDNASDTIFNVIVSTKVGETSKIGSDDTNGNFIVYVKTEKDKKSLKEVKDDITSTLIDEKVSEDSDISSKAMQSLRKEYNLKFADTELGKQYEKTLIKE